MHTTYSIAVIHTACKKDLLCPKIFSTFFTYSFNEFDSLETFCSHFESNSPLPYQLIFLDIATLNTEISFLLKKLYHTYPLIPILVLSNKDSHTATISLGAADYLVRPYSLLELSRKTQILLLAFHNIKHVKNLSDSTIMHFSDLHCNYLGQIFVHNTLLPFTEKERLLTLHFLYHPNTPFSREELFPILYPFENNVENRAIDNIVSGIRKKLKAGNSLCTISCLRNKGYLICETT